MAVDFNTFRDNIKSALETGFEDYNDFAEFIVDEYITAIEPGAEPVGGNSIVTYTDAPLRQGFKTMFQTAFDTNSILNGSLIIPGYSAFWTGATFTVTGIPPGFSSVTSVIASAITPVTFVPPPPSDSVEPFVDSLINFFQPPLTTVTGTIIGLSTSSPPVALTVPFVGYN